MMTALLWSTLLLAQFFFEVSSQSACGDASSTAVCSCVKNSNVSFTVNCTGLGIDALPGGIPINTTYLYAGRNNLVEIEHDTLLRLRNLQHIVLDYSNLISLPKFPKSIRDISAEYNNIQTIDGVFEDLPKLGRVNLDGNRIKVLKNTTFKGSMQVWSLHLNNNSLEEIQPNTFTRLNISHIVMRHNNISTLQENTFSLNGTTPCEIFLTNTGVQQIETGSFKNLGAGSSVYIYGNSITSIPSRAFIASWLNHLSLSKNGLKHIHPDAFAEVGSIWQLDLDRNELTEIPDAVYRQKVLLCLILSVNSIELSPHPNRSVLIDSPKTLVMAKNNIRSISKKHFSGLKSLEQLFLYLNHISYIEDGSFNGTNLKSIYIYGNSLKNITSETFNVYPGSLTHLYLFNNPIEHMEYEALSHLPPNSTVYLECANLEYIPSKIAESTIARCVSNKTEIIFADVDISTRKMLMYGMTCTDQKCEPCPPGYYGKLTGTGCYPCPPGGFFQHKRGYVENGDWVDDCERCPIGTFSPEPGTTSKFACRSCPSGTNTDTDAFLNACPCLENFHRTYRYGTCQPCPDGVDCTGGYQKLRAGYWWSWDFPSHLGSLNEYNQFVYNLSNDYHFELSTPNTLNDTAYNGFLPAVHRCPRSESCRGMGTDANCSEGYSAWFCAECGPNYYELFDNCHQCQNIKIIIIVMVFVIFGFVGVAYGVWRLDKRSRRGDTIRNDSFVIHLKIAINFYQVLGILSEINEIHWPDSFQSVGQSLQYLDIVRYVNILSPRCMFPGVWNAYTLLYIAIATPFVIILSTCAIFFIIWYIYRRYKEDHSVHHLTDTFLSITMMLLYLTYANTCSSIMAVGPWSVRTFNVTADGEYTKRVLTSDYSIDVDEENGSKYETNKKIVYGSLVYVIGFPLAIILVLYRRYKRHEVVGREDERPGTMGLRFFCKQYSTKFWYWEVIDMYNKAILALIANFKDDQASNMSYSLFITVILITLHLYLEPMKAKSDQRFQLLTLVFIIVNLSVGAIVDMGESVFTVDDTILVLHDITPFILLMLNLSILFAVFVDLLKKVKESFWGKWIGPNEFRNVVNVVEDNEDDENERSPIWQADVDSLSNYNPNDSQLVVE